MSAGWIRRNGQAEMRENVRAALKQARISQSAAAKQAGIGYPHLVGALGRSSWFTREDIDALAELLEMSADELIGGSIFKDQRDRHAEFDHAPPEVVEWRAQRDAELEQEAAEHADATRVGPGRTRALCCECGALRTCSDSRGLIADESPESQWCIGSRRGRFTIHLQCSSCREVTRHAALRTDVNRDQAEQFMRIPTRLDEAIRERDDLLARLADFNVHVEMVDEVDYQERGHCALIDYRDGWSIQLAASLPPRAQVAALEQSWKWIASGDFGVKWNVQKKGLVFGLKETVWSTVADELVEDIERLVNMERRRLALHAKDETEVEQ